MYDCAGPSVWEVPTTPNHAPNLPVGWSMAFSEDQHAYFYVTRSSDNTEHTQWAIPIDTRTSTPPSNQQGAYAAGWGPSSRRSLLQRKTAPKTTSKKPFNAPVKACPWTPKTKAPGEKQGTTKPVTVSIPIDSTTGATDVSKPALSSDKATMRTIIASVRSSGTKVAVLDAKPTIAVATLAKGTRPAAAKITPRHRTRIRGREALVF